VWRGSGTNPGHREDEDDDEIEPPEETGHGHGKDCGESDIGDEDAGMDEHDR